MLFYPTPYLPTPSLNGLSLRRLFLLLTPGAYGEDEGRYPDRNEDYVCHGGDAGREPDSIEERLRVDDQDEPADGGAHDTGRQYADDVGCYWGCDQAAQELCSDDRPRNVREFTAKQDADARANGDHELAGVDGAYDLARLHPSRREQRRRGNGPPPTAAEGVEEAGHKPERAQERRGDGSDLDRTLVPPERESAEDVDPEYEEEYGDYRLYIPSRSLQRGYPDQQQRA